MPEATTPVIEEVNLEIETPTQEEAARVKEKLISEGMEVSAFDAAEDYQTVGGKTFLRTSFNESLVQNVIPSENGKFRKVFFLS